MPSTNKPKKRSAKSAIKPAVPKKRVTPAQRPEHMTVEEWQTALRREYGREQAFSFKNTGGDPVLSEFRVRNPKTDREYRVVIRGAELGRNFCSCPDFQVNTLGTCKHIEFMLSRLERRRGAKRVLEMGHTPSHSEVYMQYGAQRQVCFAPCADASQKLLALSRKYFEPVAGHLRPEAIPEFDVFLRGAMALEPGLQCYEDVLDYVARVRDAQRLKERVDRLFPKGAEDAGFKKLLKTTLHPYQREGALAAARAGRFIIADDMGLGKTVQAIAAAEILMRVGAVEKVLVVTPTSLKRQWQGEIERFTGNAAQVIEGLYPARCEAYQAPDSRYKIINYDVVRRDLSLIHAWEPDLIILDEAQRIKNWKTITARYVKRLVSTHAFVLTGTPLENKLEELHSIVEFVDRFRLGPLFRFLHEHQETDDGGRVVGYRNLSTIGADLVPILIRRRKDEVLRQLPGRTDRQFFIKMTKEQWAIHSDYQDIVARIVAKWRKHHFLSEADQRRLMVCLQGMRMVCNSTYLVDDQSNHGHKIAEAIAYLDEALENPEAKAVIFSQWLRTHELLEHAIKERGWGHVLFSGSVDSKARGELIARFKTDENCRIFLSTDAGGVGLNLQCADLMLIMDQPWNPAVLEQRIGRIHRMGQARPVQVAHFIAENTIEHGMLDRLKFKKSLFAGALDGGESEVFLGGSKLDRFMKSVEEVAEAVPATPPAFEEPIDESTAPFPDGAEEEVGEEAVAGSAPQESLNLSLAGLSPLIDAGKSLFAAFGAMQKEGRSNGRGISVERDPATGESHIKIPMPDAATVEVLSGFLQALSSTLEAAARKK